MTTTDTISLTPPGGLKRIILLGAGRTCPAIVAFCRQNAVALEVWAGSRQADARFLDGTSIVAYLRDNGALVRIADDLRKADGSPYGMASDDTVVVSLGSPYIIRADLIALYGQRIINSHPAPLPAWRGGGGFSWRILAGERNGNSCIHLVTPGIDDGDVIYEKAYQFPANARVPRDFMAFSDQADSESLATVLQRIRLGQVFPRRRQREEDASYFPRLNTEQQAHIDWSWEGRYIERFIRAFSHPYGGARSFLGPCVVRFWDAQFVDTPRHDHPFFNGIVFRITGQDYWIACAGGALRIPTGDLEANGKVNVGDRLFTPISVLEDALKSRVIYSPSGLRLKQD